MYGNVKLNFKINVTILVLEVNTCVCLVYVCVRVYTCVVYV